MGGDGSGFGQDAAVGPLPAMSFGGRLHGTLADPVAQLVALVLLVSLVFAAFPSFDVWATGLFAEHHLGFTARSLGAFTILAHMGSIAVAGVLLTVLGAIVWKLLRPERPTRLSPNAIAFLLVSLVLVACLTPVVQLAAAPKRLPPTSVDVFGGTTAFVSLWQPGGGCSTDCAAFSAAASWAVWLVGLAVLVPVARRASALAALATLAIILSLNAIVRGEDYVSGVALSAATTLLMMAIAYRLTLERPMRWFRDGRLEADLTRLGLALRDALRDADWEAVALKAQSPWLDRRARLSPLKTPTFALCVLPGLWFLWLAVTGDLTPLPWVFLIYNSGVWALWFFIASLTVTPARHIFGWAELISVRRMLGIAGLAYTVLHLADYVWLDRFSLGFIVKIGRAHV